MLEGKDRSQYFVFSFSIKSVRPVLRCPHPHHCPSAATETGPVYLLMLMSCRGGRGKRRNKGSEEEGNRVMSLL